MTVLTLVPGAGENIAMHALPTARHFLFQIPTFPIDFFLSFFFFFRGWGSGGGGGGRICGFQFLYNFRDGREKEMGGGSGGGVGWTWRLIVECMR